MCLLYLWMPLVTHELFILSQPYRPHQLYLLPSGPLSALALFGRATTVLVIATL